MTKKSKIILFVIGLLTAPWGIGIILIIISLATKTDKKYKEQTEIIHKAINCPYCFHVFDKPPKRSAVCEKCSKKFFVRNFKPVTLKEKYYIDFLLEFPDISKKYLRNLLEDNRSENDYRWSLLQKSIFDKKSVGYDYDGLKLLYVKCARIVKSENKDPEPYLKLADEQVRLFFKNSSLHGKEKQQFIDQEIGFYRNFFKQT